MTFISDANDERAPKRKLIVFDGTAWFVRNVRAIVHDLERDEKVYRCDEHLGGPFSDVQEALNSLPCGHGVQFCRECSDSKVDALIAEIKRLERRYAVCRESNGWQSCRRPRGHEGSHGDSLPDDWRK